ncbi:hypothetical protein ADK53_10090 [Streptomyces sp. WM6373]|uniref:hypothetical protein n=1 Tax=unclassified Streptomyces TaxID=2593676 RepID=UPI0006AE90CF|nr:MULTISPECIES: hypothetical protein [unclassified Streptomyces]KOU40287.1 hypothetical protein ADK53_10090 [Streptomyces sp. WM6373]KOU89520.1 hypothetical protein ADK93_11055 [Streptomyces sp. XY58]KOV08636.1 hypothetical protein ADK89_07770 [Streptomyces sp. XY37]KOV50763.1 hypothetical protein ADK99_09250 [Streptomyces sp. MMG1064]
MRTPEPNAAFSRARRRRSRGAREHRVLVGELLQQPARQDGAVARRDRAAGRHQFHAVAHRGVQHPVGDRAQRRRQRGHPDPPTGEGRGEGARHGAGAAGRRDRLRGPS